MVKEMSDQENVILGPGRGGLGQGRRENFAALLLVSPTAWESKHLALAQSSHSGNAQVTGVCTSGYVAHQLEGAEWPGGYIGDRRQLC
jgi:hypothetical protein